MIAIPATSRLATASLAALPQRGETARRRNSHSELRLTSIGGELKRVVAVRASLDRKFDAVRELAQVGRGHHVTFVIVQSDRANMDGRGG